MARLRVGLTGGIASGKSMADAAFAALGATVVDADLISRDLVQPNQPALSEIVSYFGDEVLAEGRLDRGALRRRIFANAADKAALEAILHPRIRAELEARTAVADTHIAIASIPLLAEGGGRNAYPWLDRVLVIDVDADMQRTRLMARDGIDAALADRMIDAQATRVERFGIADDIIRNDSTPDALRAQVAELYQFYLGLAGSAAD